MNCPKCTKPVAIVGEATIESVSVDVYQCDLCISEWLFEGRRFEAAFTFAVFDGQFFNPDTLELIHLN